MSKLFRQLKEAALRRAARKENLLTDALRRAEEARSGRKAAPAAPQRMLVKDPTPPTPELAELQGRFGFSADDDEAREAERQRRDAEAVATAARVFAEKQQREDDGRERQARERGSTLYRRLDPRRRVTLSRGTVAAWGVATALLAIWEIASWQAPRPPGQPGFVRLLVAREAPEPQAAVAPHELKLDYALDLTRTGGAARSSPRGPAPSR